MKTGLLWQNHDPRPTLKQHIAIAIAVYLRKHGTMPDVCAINARVPDPPTHVGTVRVVGMGTVLAGHYWVGKEELKEGKSDLQ